MPSILRPHFTQQLLKALLNNESINLISPHGQGRRRTLQDLRNLLPDSIHVLQVDMRTSQNNPTHCLETLKNQTKKPDIVDFETLIIHLSDKRDHTLIIVHNFNENNDKSMIHHLNLIQNHNNIALLCVSEKEHTNSQLDAKHLLLPPINKEQLMIELAHRSFSLNIETMADYLLQQSAPYSLLDELDLKHLSPNPHYS